MRIVPSRRARFERVELAPDDLEPPARASRRPPYRVAERPIELRGVPAPHRQARGVSRQRRPAAGHVHPAAETLHAPVRARPPAARAADRCARELVLPRHDQFGGRRRRRRADVGDEIGDRDVGLVADRRDDRHRRGGDRARDDFLVERPEVLDRPAAASDDDDVDARHAADGAQPARDLAGRAFALHARRADHEVRVRVAPPQHLDDVADRGAVERGDDADLARQRRQRPLARGVEQPFGLQPLLQLIEGELQRAEALRLQVLADELIFAFRLVDGDRPRATTRRPSAGLNFR